MMEAVIQISMAKIINGINEKIDPTNEPIEAVRVLIINISEIIVGNNTIS